MTARAVQPTLRAEGLEFTYRRGDPAVVRKLDHSFGAGTLTAVTGPSGCGKSTLLYLLGLMLRPTAGRILWHDQDVSALSDGERSDVRARLIGFVFQDAVLDASRSILANVTEGALYAGIETEFAQRRARALLSEFGLDRPVDRRPGEISGGQAQRVALCRALVKQPKIILADEPSGNLDVTNADVVWNALGLAAEAGSTVIVATHDQQRAATAGETIRL